MIKPASLQAALYASGPIAAHARNDPANLHFVAKEGSIHATGARGRSFEYRYELVVGVFDYAGGLDAVVVPILEWCARHQRELLTSPAGQKAGIGYEAEVIDDKRMDLYVTLPLTETVRFVRREDGGYDVEHINDEPIDLEEGAPAPLHRVYANGELIAACSHLVA